jgi:hypothetical protein
MNSADIASTLNTGLKNPVENCSLYPCPNVKTYDEMIVVQITPNDSKIMEIMDLNRTGAKKTNNDSKGII